MKEHPWTPEEPNQESNNLSAHLAFQILFNFKKPKITRIALFQVTKPLLEALVSKDYHGQCSVVKCRYPLIHKELEPFFSFGKWIMGIRGLILDTSHMTSKLCLIGR